MTPEQEETNDLIKFKITNNNPIKNPKQYEIKTIEDIFNCVTHENIKGFMTDFEMMLMSYLLMDALIKAQISDGKLPEGTKTPIPTFTWIDDWKRKKKKTK